MKISAIALALVMGAMTAHGDVIVKRAYVDMRYGQLHYVSADPGKVIAARHPPLVYFTQSPYTSIEFGKLLTEMGRDRLVLAIDTPGYGGSDGPMSVPAIEDYQAAVAEALKNLGFGGRRKIDLIGLHTGAFTAIEMAIREPQMIRSITLVGVYNPTEEQRLAAIAALPRYHTTKAFFDWFHSALPRLQQKQLGQNLPDEEWGQIMADSLRPLTRREYGHDAAFEYAARLKERAPLVMQPVLLMAIDDGLRELTLTSQSLFQHVTLADFPALQEGAFYTHAPQLGAALRAFLDTQR